MQVHQGLCPTRTYVHYSTHLTPIPLCLTLPCLVQVSDEEGLQQLGLAPKEVALALLEAFADMTFVQGFVHGDPHPGAL